MTNNEIINSNMDDFCRYMLPFGSSDIWHCVDTALNVDLSMSELKDIITEYCESCDINPFDDSKHTLDINYILWDYILQQARYEIEKLTGIDIESDLSVYVSGNYMCTSFDWKSEDPEEIELGLRDANVTMDDLCVYTNFLLSQMDILIEAVAA